MSTVLRGSTGCLGVPGRHPGSSGLPEGFLKAAKAWANLEQLVRVSLERNLGRVFQAEGTAWEKHRGMLQGSPSRWGSVAVQGHRGEMERWG